MKDIVVSSIGNKIKLDEKDSKELYSHLPDELKEKLDKIQENNAVNLSEAIDVLFGILSNKMRCNKWLVRVVSENSEKYQHLLVNSISTDRFIIDFDRNGGEMLISEDSPDWEQTSDWSE